MTDARVVLTTMDELEKAKQMARELVELRLAACVNLIERVHSIYRWEDGVETANEVLLMIKTSADRVPALKEAVARLHSYQVPEVIVLEISDGSAEYLAWLGSASGENTKLP